MIDIKTVIRDENGSEWYVNSRINLDDDITIRSLLTDLRKYYASLEDTNRNLITKKKLASILDISLSTVNSMVIKENMPASAIKHGNIKTFNVYELDNFFRTRKPQYFEKFHTWLNETEDIRNLKTSAIKEITKERLNDVSSKNNQ